MTIRSGGTATDAKSAKGGKCEPQRHEDTKKKELEPLMNADKR
jgi:hypothetical protein